MVRIAICLAFILGGCSVPGSVPRASTSVGPDAATPSLQPIAGVSGACATAFQVAAAMASPSDQDYIRMFVECPTQAEFETAGKAIPDAFHGQDVVGVVKKYCEDYPEVKESAVCAALP
jgi:hypothetical protein